MNLNLVVQTDQKGQIILPKEVGKALGVGRKTTLKLVFSGGGIYIYPVEDDIFRLGRKNSYLEVLKMTQGSWRGEGWENFRKRRGKIELLASKKRKKLW